jgi:hypothetical protein
MVGGNDFELGSVGPADFTAAYDAFVGLLRAKYPTALIFLAASPSLSDLRPAGKNTRTNVLAAIAQVSSSRQAAGDARLKSVIPGLATPEELTGCDGHGTPALHGRIAAELAPVLRTALGW